MDLIPIEGSGVKGSHGRLSPSAGAGPLLASRCSGLISSSSLKPADVHDIILAHLQD
jgi:hypothetical protein